MNIFDSEFQNPGKGNNSVDFMFNAQSYFTNNQSEPHLFSFDTFGIDSYTSLPLGNKNCSIFDGVDGFRKSEQTTPWDTPWSNGESVQSESRVLRYHSPSLPSSSPPLESLSVHEFLHHGTGNSPSLSSTQQSAFPDFLSDPFESLSLGGMAKSQNGGTPNHGAAHSDLDGVQSLGEQGLSVWDSLNSFSVNLSESAPVQQEPAKNAWSKPLTFQENTATKSKVPWSKTPPPSHHSSWPTVSHSSPASTAPEPLPAPSVGSRVSELDSFDYTIPRSLPRPGGFQVVCNKKGRGAATKQSVSKPSSGIEKCSYGVKCVFGRECANWHPTDELEEFSKQGSGPRRCPWGAKCFRGTKCQNLHTKSELQQATSSSYS